MGPIRVGGLWSWRGGGTSGFSPFHREFGCIAKAAPGARLGVILASPASSMQSAILRHLYGYGQVGYLGHPAAMAPPQMPQAVWVTNPAQGADPPHRNPIAENLVGAYDRVTPVAPGCTPKSKPRPKEKTVTEPDAMISDRERRAVSGPWGKRWGEKQYDATPVIPPAPWIASLKRDTEIASTRLRLYEDALLGPGPTPDTPGEECSRCEHPKEPDRPDRYKPPKVTVFADVRNRSESPQGEPIVTRKSKRRKRPLKRDRTSTDESTRRQQPPKKKFKRKATPISLSSTSPPPSPTPGIVSTAWGWPSPSPSPTRSMERRDDECLKVLAESMAKFRDVSKKMLALQCKEEQRAVDAAQVRESALRRRAVTDPYGCPDVTVDL